MCKSWRAITSRGTDIWSRHQPDISFLPQLINIQLWTTKYNSNSAYRNGIPSSVSSCIQLVRIAASLRNDVYVRGVGSGERGATTYTLIFCSLHIQLTTKTYIYWINHNIIYSREVILTQNIVFCSHIAPWRFYSCTVSTITVNAVHG